MTSQHSLLAGEVIREAISANDPDGDPMTFRIIDNPGFLSIQDVSQQDGTANATLVIAPTLADTGTFEAMVEVRDSHEDADSASCSLLIGPQASVTVILHLPSPAPDRPYGVFIDYDIDPDNGYVTADMGLTDSGTELTYSLGRVDPGTYLAYAAVCVASACDEGPVQGDWFGVYGTPIRLQLAPQSGEVGDYVDGQFTASYNAEVSSTGVTTFDITLREFDPAQDVALTVGDVSGTEFIVSLGSSSVDFLIPNAGAAGTHPVTAILNGSVLTNAVDWTQLSDQDPTDPDNNNLETAPPIEIPVDGVGSFLKGDVVDWYVFTLDAQTSIEAKLDWNNEKDLDLYVCDETGEIECGAWTLERPEQFACTLPAATHYLAVVDYDAYEFDDYALVSYRGTASISQAALSASANSRAAIDPAKAAMIERLRR